MARLTFDRRKLSNLALAIMFGRVRAVTVNVESPPARPILVRGGAGKLKGRRNHRRGSHSPAGRAWNKARRREGWWTHKTPAQIYDDVQTAFDVLKANAQP